jgi:hypothetical protein
MSSIAIDGFDNAPPSISSESEDHSLEVLVSMDLEEEETVDEADSSSTPDEHATNGHEVKMFIDPTERDFSELTADLIEYCIRSHHNIPMPYCDYKGQIKFYVDKLHQELYRWSFGKVDRVFSISRGAIHRHYRRMCAGKIQPIGRPNLMTTDEFE